MRLPAALGQPALIGLPRVRDNLSFVYLDTAQIVQDNHGVCATVEGRRGGERVYIPTAALACLLLGPGTSITHQAAATLTRHGTTLAFVGDGGVRCYSVLAHKDLSTHLLEQQARVVTDPNARVAAATRLYRRRFPTTLPATLTLDQLRGYEGHQVRALYQALAKKHRLPGFRRSYDPAEWDDQDPVNKALSAGNAALYGLTQAVTVALGASPGLGIIHSGHALAFVHDIADIYKPSTTIPLAFALHDHPEPEAEVRRRLRDQFRLLKLIPAIVHDIHHALGLDDRTEPADPPSMVNLWDPNRGPLPAGTNYANEAPT